jgi:xylan 1,4-beta-xylosidase
MVTRSRILFALRLALPLLALPACGSPPAVETKQVGPLSVALWIDASQTTVMPPHFWSAAVGTGTASLTLRGDLETQLKIGNREAGFQRVRGHGVLNDDMAIYQGPGVYDWVNFDRYLTAITAAGMRPLMEMDFMPSKLALGGDSRDSFKDRSAYRDFIGAVVDHAIFRFGAADVAGWYWEIWNEPDYDFFWRGHDFFLESRGDKMDDYEVLYDNAAAAIHAILPGALVGGPAATNPKPLGGFLRHCKSTGTPVAFVSSHIYPGGASGDTADASALVGDNDARLAEIVDAGYAPADVMSFNTEWNSSYSGQGGGTSDVVVSMDNQWNAGFILEAVKLLADRTVDGTPPLSVFSYWALSDIFDESNGPSGSYMLGHDGGNLPFGSVFGLITAQGVRKASFNAFKMLNHLGPLRLASSGGSGGEGVDAIATMSAAGDELQILAYDQFKKLDTTGTDTVRIDLENVPAALVGRQVFVTRYLVDAAHSNPYGVWDAQGRPGDPSEAQWEAMRAAQHLWASPVETTTLGTSYTTSFTMQRQSGTLLVLGLARPVTGRDGLAPIEGEDYDGQAGALKLDSTDSDLGQMVVLSGAGSLLYDVVDFGDAGVDAVDLRVQAPSATTVELHTDAADGPLVATCALDATTDRSWPTVSCPLAHTSGVHTLYLVFEGAANLNWLQFQRAP